MTTTTFISSTTTLSTLLTSLTNLPTSPPSLYLDLEGAKLSRHGTISLLTLYIPPKNTIYLIDIHTLGATAFSTPSTPLPTNEPSITLKSLLESPTTPKIFFDVRNDSDALFAHYNIALQCIHDVQLMELATRRTPSRTHLSSLAKCIEHDVALSAAEQQQSRHVKEQGLNLFSPERGGSYAVFNERPLRAAVRDYCVLDAVHMPGLWRAYSGRMSAFWWVMVREAGAERVRESQGVGYVSHGGHKALGCWSGAQIRVAERRWQSGVRSGLCA
ncbi:exonuclease [Dothidotthia symphoricarpi CBS 119687]|uniref:Exonuclease n=1 Tax=Dothidotthia symphoricarpi CBS 119687 TaxID=1392245 RepID=A0A6A6AGC4_9PLEO|nr:exonuclease [Dothidotthia symphoricarpi CBS 119687]KAF2129967.1 exonuclease [Dothidotthia symphoricarpi CBS 119687]